MKLRCRLCGRKTVEDSIFCADHREQAARFSQSFGSQDADAKPAKPAKAAPPEPDPSPARERAATPPPAEAPVRDADEERAVLAAAFHPAFSELRSRLREQADPDRWAQLSVYFLEETLYCRAYFSIIPRARSDESAGKTYSLDDSQVHATVASGGAVFEELFRCFQEKDEALRDQSLQTLDVHFLTYAGLIAINAHAAGRRNTNLTTLKLEGDDFNEVDLDDVRALMGHDYW